MEAKVSRHSRSILSKFRFCARGAVAVIWGIALVPILIAAGTAVDWARYIDAHSDLQATVDGAVLAAVNAKRSNPGLSDEELEAIAQSYFNSNNNSGITAKTVALERTSSADENSAYRLTAIGDQPTTLMSVANIDSMDHTVNAEATVATGMPLELALVLDVTGSMTGAKIAALKTAASDLIKYLMEPEASAAKISIVPFSDYVNVGTKYRKASWISVPDDYTESKYQCTMSKPVISKTNCKKVKKTCSNDGVKYECTQEQCDITYGKPVESCGIKKTTHKWNGCVGSRPYPYNINDQGYAKEKVPGLLDISCARTLTPLSDDEKALDKEIKALSASGNTYIPAGLLWGWRTLTAIEPFDQAQTKEAMAKKGGIRALVLMTDGANVRSPRYPDHAGSNVALANQLMSETCKNVKNDGVQLYTIAFEVNDATTEDLLRQCATSDENYYDAEDAAQLAAAFAEIGQKLTSLHLSK